MASQFSHQKFSLPPFFGDLLVKSVSCLEVELNKPLPKGFCSLLWDEREVVRESRKLEVYLFKIYIQGNQLRKWFNDGFSIHIYIWNQVRNKGRYYLTFGINRKNELTGYYRPRIVPNFKRDKQFHQKHPELLYSTVAHPFSPSGNYTHFMSVSNPALHSYNE